MLLISVHNFCNLSTLFFFQLTKLPRQVVEKISCHIIFYSGIGCNINAVSKLQRKNQTKFEYPVNVVRNAARMVQDVFFLSFQF